MEFEVYTIGDEIQVSMYEDGHKFCDFHLTIDEAESMVRKLNLAWLEKQGEQNTLNADEVIEWLKTEWEDLGINWVRGVYADEIIDKFKKDFGL